MKLVTRSEWGARPPKYVNDAPLSAESTCHYNGPDVTVGGQLVWDHSNCAALVRGIQSFHMDGRGWSDIAYNFVECPHGYTFVGRGLNVINGANGTTSGNRSSHAVMCLAGEANPFSDAEKIGFRECVEYISENTLAPSTCRGHRDWKSTACPGETRYAWVHAGMPIPEIPTQKDDDDMVRIVNLTDPKDPGKGVHTYAVSGVTGRHMKRNEDIVELINRFDAADERGKGTTSSLMFDLVNGPLMTPHTTT